MRPIFDEKDEVILSQRIQSWNERMGPRVGDYIRLKDGALERFTYHWPDGMQTGFGGSFYLGTGYVSYSGSLNPNIPIDRIQDTGEMMNGTFWFFHHDMQCAHNGVDVKVPCRMYEEVL